MNAARVCFYNYSKPPSSVDCFPWRLSLLINMSHEVLAADETLHIIGCHTLASAAPTCLCSKHSMTKKKTAGRLSGAGIENFTHSLVNYLHEESLTHRKSLSIANSAPWTLTRPLLLPPLLQELANNGVWLFEMYSVDLVLSHFLHQNVSMPFSPFIWVFSY